MKFKKKGKATSSFKKIITRHVDIEKTTLKDLKGYKKS